VSDVTRVLPAIELGEPQAADQLLPLVDDELRRLARARMAAQPPGHTLQPTALVHEAYLRLVGPEGQRWQNSRHFFAAAAEAMRHILIDAARKKQRPKHGGQWKRLSLEEVQLALESDRENLLAVNDALEQFALEEARQRWAALIKQVYEVDPLLCPKCGGTMKILSFIERGQREVIRRRSSSYGGTGRKDPPAWWALERRSRARAAR